MRQERVKVNRYALCNACLANGISSNAMLSDKIGRSHSFIAGVFKLKDGYFGIDDYNKICKVLHIEDDSLMKMPETNDGGFMKKVAQSMIEKDDNEWDANDTFAERMRKFRGEKEETVVVENPVVEKKPQTLVEWFASKANELGVTELQLIDIMLVVYTGKDKNA